LPSFTGVVVKLVFLNPHCGLGKQIDAAHVIPMRVADDDVGDVAGLHAGEFDQFTWLKKIPHRKFLEPFLAVKTAVEQDVVSPTANQPDDHGDIDLLILRSAHHQAGDGKSGDGGVAQGLNGIVWHCR